MKKPCKGKYTFEQCLDMASQYHSYKELFDKKRSLYTYVYRRDWLDPIAEKLGWEKRPSKYTFEVCRNIASVCHNRNEMIKKRYQAYRVSKANGWITQFAEEFGWTDYKIYTYEKCREIASSVKSRTAFNEANQSAYEVAIEHGWVDGFAKEFRWLTKHELLKLSTEQRQQVGFVRKGGATYRTIEDVVEAARKYSTFKDFRKKAPNLYGYLQRRGKLDLISFLPRGSHMFEGRAVDTVYVYEFKTTGHAYVGRSMDLPHRDSAHRRAENDPVLMHSIEYGVEIPPIKVLCTDIHFKEGAEMEKSMIRLYRALGWTMLNKSDGGELGSIGIKKWTIQNMINAARKYVFWQDFNREVPGAATKLRKMHLKHLVPWLKLKVQKWDDVTFETAKEIASDYSYSEEFRKANRRLGEICLNNGWMELLFPYKKHISDSARLKISKKVDQYTMDGKFVCSHDSMVIAANSVNGGRTMISAACRGRCPSAYGFIWKYAKQEEAA